MFQAKTSKGVYSYTNLDVEKKKGHNKRYEADQDEKEFSFVSLQENLWVYLESWQVWRYRSWQE